MNKMVLNIMICLAVYTPLASQTEIAFQGMRMRVVDHQVYDPALLHTVPILTTDDKQVVAFKTYFNASSVLQFKSMFLPEDWTPTTPAEFGEWQQLLKENPLRLHMAIQVEDETRTRYLILRYIMMTNEIDFYQSKVMKWEQGGWKHRNLDTTAQTVFFETIGSVDQELLEPALRSQQSRLSLDRLNPARIITYKEKFNMADLLPKLAKGLAAYKIAADDVSHATHLFSLGDPHGMIEYIADKYHIVAGELMGAINTAIGFSYYQFAYVKNQPAQ